MNRASGDHFFDRDTTRCFRSRVVPGIYSGTGGVYFVTSEANYNNTSRKFSVRTFDPSTGDVSTFGEFNDLTRGAAISIAKRAAASSVPPCRICGGSGVKYTTPCWKCTGKQAAA